MRYRLKFSTVGFLLSWGIAFAAIPLVCAEPADRAAPASKEQKTPLHLAILTSKSFDQLGLEGTLATSLEGDPQVALVDRSAIAKVAAELDVAALCRVEAIGQRQALGKTLSADMLLILRASTVSAKAKQYRVQLLAVDCHRGVQVMEKLFSGDRETLLKSLTGAIGDACKKGRSGVRHIVGIMPLVPGKSRTRFEQLYSGLPCLMKKMLQHDTSVTIPSAEECLAIARERKLGTIADTSVPITIFKGTYQITHRPDPLETHIPKTVHVELQATRNGQPVAELGLELKADNHNEIAFPPDAIRQVRQFLQDALSEVSGDSSVSFSEAELTATVEEMYRQLQAQADADAVDQVSRLSEAILLLAPQHTGARLYSIGAFRRHSRIAVFRQDDPFFTPDERTLLKYHALLRITEHLEYLVRHRQLTVTQASLLYYRVAKDLTETLPRVSKEYDNYRSRPLEIAGQGLSEEQEGEVIKLFCETALPMMRNRVKDLPQKYNFPLNEPFTYAMRSVLQMQNHANRYAYTFDPPKEVDPPESHLLCWHVCSTQMAMPLHAMAQLLSGESRVSQEDIDQGLVDFEEERVRSIRVPNCTRYLSANALVKNLAEIREYHPALAEKYKAMYDRLEKADDIQLQIHGLAGNFSRVPGITLFDGDKITPEQMDYTLVMFDKLNRLTALCKKVEPEGARNGLPKYHWEQRLFYWVTCNMSHWCGQYLGSHRRLADMKSFVYDKVPEGKYPAEIVAKAKRKLKDMSNTYNGLYAKFPSDFHPFSSRYHKIKSLQDALASDSKEKYAKFSPIPGIRFDGCFQYLALGKEADLIVEPFALKVMRRRWIVEPFFEMPISNAEREKARFTVAHGNRSGGHSWTRQWGLQRKKFDYFFAAFYDGKYIWTAASQSGLRVFDVEGNLVGELAKPNGHPFSALQGSSLCPDCRFVIEKPGKVIFAYTTKSTTDITRLSVESGAKLSCQMLHRADIKPKSDAVEDWLPAETYYCLGPWIRLFCYGDQSRWLAVPRLQKPSWGMRSARIDATYSTLWIDLDHPSDIRTDEQRIGCYYQDYFSLPKLQNMAKQTPFVHLDDRELLLRFYLNKTHSSSYSLCELRPPKVEDIGKGEIQFENLLEGQKTPRRFYACSEFAEDEAYIYHLREDWSLMRIDKKTKRLETFQVLNGAGGLPYLSAHYGLVSVQDDKLYQITREKKSPPFGDIFKNSSIPPDAFDAHVRAMEQMFRAGAMIVPASEASRMIRPRSDGSQENRYVKLRGKGSRIKIDQNAKDVSAICRSLSGVYSIAWLVIDQAKMTEKDFAYMADLEIENLAIHLPPDKDGYSPLNDKTAKYLFRIRGLDKLYIHGNGMTDAGLATIGNARDLERLHLISDRFSDAAMPYVSNAPKLKAFTFQGKKFTDEGLVRLRSSGGSFDVFPIRTGITLEGLTRYYAR